MADMLAQFKTWVTHDPTVKNMWAKVENGTASYQDAQRYARLVSNECAKLLAPLKGTADYSAVMDEIDKTLMKNYSESAYYAKSVQGIVNKKAGVGMKALEPAMDKTRIENLRTKLLEEDEEAEWLLDKPVVENIAKSAVTDTIQANARIQAKAGLKTTMSRHLGSDGCCAWCQMMADGKEYAYGEQPDDFWRFHKDCDCYIEYHVNGRTDYINTAR